MPYQSQDPSIFDASIRVSKVYRERRFWKNGWQCWYEECPVIRHTNKFVVVHSETYPDTPLYPGGEFSLNRQKLIQDGKSYHSRHGEYFYLEKPSQGFLFPSKDVMESPDPLITELKSLGWEQYNLTDEQLHIYATAVRLNTNLGNVIKSSLHKEFF